MASKSKILIIGGTGYIGKFLVEASAKEGHPTFALVRQGTVSDAAKGQLIEKCKNLGVTIVYGDICWNLLKRKEVTEFGLLVSYQHKSTIFINIHDHGSLVKAFKQVDVVISAVGAMQLADQTKIIPAIKEAGNIKRFFPSEFGNDADRVSAVDPMKSIFEIKAQIRHAVEAAGIPYTYAPCNYLADYFLPVLCQEGVTAPPRDKVTILGDGNPKAIFNKEEDIATYTIKAVDDPRTLNKTLAFRPPKNIYCFNELVALWEKKIGKTLEKTYVSEEQVLKAIQEAPIPTNIILSINHSVFIKGDQTNYEVDPSWGAEVSELYPDVKYTSVEEYLEQFV